MDNAAAQHLIKEVKNLNRTIQHQNNILIEIGKLIKERNGIEGAKTQGTEAEGHPSIGGTGQVDSDLRPAGEGVPGQGWQDLRGT